MKKYSSKFMTAAAANLLLWLTALFFSSVEIYYRNIAEFNFPPRHVWWIMLAASCIIALCVAALEALLPAKAALWIGAVSVLGGICFYVQMLFLNGQMIEMMGENVPFDTKTVGVNLFTWLLIAGCFLALCALINRRAGQEKLKETLMLVSAALIVIQTVGLVSVRLALTEEDLDKDRYLTTEGEFVLSPKKNVLYFILDNCDRKYVEGSLAADPDIFAEFTGFTNYQNMTSKYSRTYPSLPFLLTGEKCYFDLPSEEFIRQAYENGTFLPDMDGNGTDVRLYTSLNYIDRDAYPMVDNVTSYNSEALNVLSVPNLFKAMVHFEFYDRLLAEKVTVNNSFSSTFRLYHLFGPHPGCYMNAEAEYDPSASQTDAARGDFKILSQYLRYLKETGLYDNTAIIVTADHGNQNEAEDFVLHSPPCCVMLFKPVGADSSKPMAVSDAPVCHDDLFATVLEQLGADSSAYPPALTTYEEGDDRERIYYYTAQRSWGDGEVALREYSIRGDAADLANWTLTGNDWDIIYSDNAVSKERLSRD